MIVKDLLDHSVFKLVAGESGLSKEISKMYASDLLSWVVSHGDEGMLYLTILTNHNVMAVAYLLDFSCVVICEGAKPSAELINRADEKGIPVLSTEMSLTEATIFLNDIGVS